MRAVFVALIVFFAFVIADAQATSSVVETIKVYSQNEKFYLHSIPFDSEFPSVRGVTHVYQKGSETPLYSFDRGFDSVDEDSNNLTLSNDGLTIAFVIPWGADEDREGLRSVTIYRLGKILRSFTESEITGCNLKLERCDLVYSNYEQVVDKTKSNFGTGKYKKVFKDGVDESEQFLSDYPLFSCDDKLYITDSKKLLHEFDLNTGNLTRTRPFSSAFEEIKRKARFNKVETSKHDVSAYPEFPKTKGGIDTSKALAIYLDMKPASIMGTEDEQYRIYQFHIDTVVSRDGIVTIEKIEVGDDLPKEKILRFFATNSFNLDIVSPIFPKWHFSNYFYFRNKNDFLARKEKRDQIKKDREELKKRLVAETIGDRYIPKDLGDAFDELDKLLPEVDRKEMAALKSRKDMIEYHMGLGMWMRNNWGLWGGSRLQKYFIDRGVRHPDDMSSVVLFFYWEWLHGKKDSWKDWERDPKQKLF